MSDIFQSGDEVVCIDDKFESWAIGLYDELPIKGYTYTVRDTSMGREDPKDQGIDSMAHSITLKEIRNKKDPKFKGGKQELQFKASRFRKLTELFEEVKATNHTLATM